MNGLFASRFASRREEQPDKTKFTNPYCDLNDIGIDNPDDSELKFTLREYILWANQKGLVHGACGKICPDATGIPFQPKEPLTRAQVAKIIALARDERVGTSCESEVSSTSTVPAPIIIDIEQPERVVIPAGQEKVLSVSSEGVPVGTSGRQLGNDTYDYYWEASGGKFIAKSPDMRSVEWIAPNDVKDVQFFKITAYVANRSQYVAHQTLFIPVVGNDTGAENETYTITASAGIGGSISPAGMVTRQSRRESDFHGYAQ
jgi:hypothetical protein